MNHLKRLGHEISIPIHPDAEGYIGRECPQPDCKGYFKITTGTGLKGNPPCHCPYCGHKAEHDQFWTREQIEYAKSVALNQITGALLKDLKAMEFNRPPRGVFGIGVSMKVTGQPHPIRYYRERQLETEIVCDCCTLRYAIYGMFAFCPDCGTHNSRQILEKNLELVEKEIALATTVQPELTTYLVADALENIVSAFDGFGRETCRVHAAISTAPTKVESISFQNLAGARDRVQEIFGFDLAAGVPTSEWEFICQCSQKRHLLAHRMGVVDQAYLKATHDPHAVVGRRISITSEEVATLVCAIRQLGSYLVQQLEGAPGGLAGTLQSKP